MRPFEPGPPSLSKKKARAIGYQGMKSSAFAGGAGTRKPNKTNLKKKRRTRNAISRSARKRNR